MTPTSPKLRRLPTYRMPHDHPIVRPLTPNIPLRFAGVWRFFIVPFAIASTTTRAVQPLLRAHPIQNAARIANGNSAAADVLPTAIDGARRRMRANRLSAASA